MKYNHFNLFYIKIDVSIINGLKEADRATPICRLYQAVNTSNNQKVEHTICLCLAGLPLTKPHSVSISSRHQTCPACFSGLTSEVRLHGAEASAQESQCRAQLDTTPTDHKIDRICGCSDSKYGIMRFDLGFAHPSLAK
jgi:hypothetical protein